MIKPDSNLNIQTSSQVWARIKLHPLTLAFRGDQHVLEEQFQDHFFTNGLPVIRVSCFLVLILFAVFGILDAHLVPESKTTLWLIRYAFCCPLTILFFFFTYLSYFKKLMQPALVLWVILAGAGIITMIIIAPPPASFSYYAGLILVFMTGYTLIKIRFVWATLAGWLIVVLYEIAAIKLTNTPIPVLVNNNFFFISANVIGMASCYAIELYTRKNFFLGHMLKEEQKKVRTARDKLETKVEERTSQLLETNTQLEKEINVRKQAETDRSTMEAQLLQAQKMEAIGTLAGGIAHDFNNILSAITGYTDLALLVQPNDAEMKEYLKGIRQGSKRATDLVAQILAFSRQTDLQKQPVNIIPVIKEALKMLRASLPTSIEIRQNLPAISRKIMADPVQIHQILMNLCTNAFHALRDESGRIEISVAEVTIDSDDVSRLPELKTGPHLKLTVSDTGKGMEQDVAKRIFEPFFTTKDVGKGTGMGLAVVHGIVKSHHGIITMQSKPGQGTTFELYFPAIDDEDQLQATMKNEVLSLPKGDETILFVDDEPELIAIGEKTLVCLGYQVVTSQKSVQALEIFRSRPERFDLVITDQTMPEMNGADFARELLAIRSDLPIILCTGFSEKINEKSAREIGIREFAMKPLSLQNMALLIRKVLDNPR